MEKITLSIKGMHCASCAASIASALNRAPGIARADANFATSSAWAEYDPEQTGPDQISRLVEKLGYQAAKGQETAVQTGGQKEKSQGVKAVLALVLAFPLFIRMFWMWEIPGAVGGVSLSDWLQHNLAFVVVFFLGWRFHANAARALARKRADMDTLISLGTLSAYAYSVYAMFAGGHLYFESAAVITALILLGRYFEAKTRGRAGAAMKKLLEYGVSRARVLDQGREIMKDIGQVKPGETILVKPGEKIPLDGIVAEGGSNVDEAMLSGESLPVFKAEGAAVYAATINLDSALWIRVAKDAGNSVFKQIIRAVEEAQAYKAPVQRLADRISAVFVPAVIGLAFISLAGWYYASGDIGQSLLVAISVLIISCPCALGIATPIAVMVGTSVGARQGILIKNGASFEKTKKISALVFDKTGTLTAGRPSVSAVIPAPAGFSEDKILKIAASLSALSAHPLSKAIAAYAGKQKLALAAISGFAEIPGHGLAGTCTQHQTELLMGNLALLKTRGINAGWAETLLAQESLSGQSLNFVVHGRELIGAIAIADPIKESSAEAVSRIKALGIAPFIISGDNRQVVAAVAAKLGINDYFAEVLPREKQAKVKELQARGENVAFAGDGINDAPALVQADLGIAMAAGADIAKESGDIIIMKNDPRKIAAAITLAQKTFAVIRQNLFLAFFYNTLAIPLAVFGLINPMIAAAAMGLSSLSVVGNSLRIYRSGI